MNPTEIKQTEKHEIVIRFFFTAPQIRQWKTNKKIYIKRRHVA